MNSKNNPSAWAGFVRLVSGGLALSVAMAMSNIACNTQSANPVVPSIHLAPSSAMPQYNVSFTTLSILRGQEWGTHSFGSASIAYLWYTSSGKALGASPYTWPDNNRLGSVFGNGQCTEVPNRLGGIPYPTSNWRRGAHVLDGNVPAGTPIATFDYDSRNGRWFYSGHAGLFDHLNSDGSISLWHQNYPIGSPLNHGRIYHTYAHFPDPTNSGNYYVIQ